MNSDDPSSSDFSYKKYSLEKLDEWLNDGKHIIPLYPKFDK